jgi:hypothetical protein
LIPLSLCAEGGELLLRGRSAEGLWEERLTVAPVPNGSGRAEVVSLFARESVEDLEARVAAGESSIDPQIEKIGLDFGVSTRLTSWVAVTETPSVDPQSAVRRERMPQQLPHGVSAEALGLRAPAGAPTMAYSARSARVTSLPCPSPMTPLPRMRASAMLDEAPFRAMAQRVGIAPSASSASEPPSRGPSTGPRPIFVEPPRFDDTQYDDALAEEHEGDEPSQGTERTLRAHVLRRKGDKLVLEIEVGPTGLDWEPPSLCTVKWTNGTTSRLLVHLGPTTRASTLRAGERARLVLCLDAAHGSLIPLDVRLVLSTVTLRLTL